MVDKLHMKPPDMQGRDLAGARVHCKLLKM